MSIALQVRRSSGGTVNTGANVVFEETVFSTSDISYDNGTGIITLQQPGRYLINWWVATQSSLSSNGANFALSSSQGDYIEGASPIKTGQVYGVGIINVQTTPVTVSLLNSSNASFYYASQVPYKASLAVTKDTATAETMRCFAVAQLANLLAQMIVAYSETIWTIYTYSLASYSGQPLDLYASPDASGPGLLRLLDTENHYEALPIANITAIWVGSGTVYDPSFTYLPAPNPLPSGCDTDLIAALQSYLPIGTFVDSIRLGASISASGAVYRNEYGVLVLSDGDGNTPVFIATPHILRIYTSDDPSNLVARRTSSMKPSISIVKE